MSEELLSLCIEQAKAVEQFASRVYLKKEILQLEKASIDQGSSAHFLMQQAGFLSAQKIQNLLAKQDKKRFKPIVFCGKGGNGGDGLACAYFLSRAYPELEIIVAFDEDQLSLKSPQETFYQLIQGAIAPEQIKKAIQQEDLDRLASELLEKNQTHSLIFVDALFGNAFTGVPKQPYAGLIDLINRVSCLYVFSLDLPSGLEADSWNSFSEHKSNEGSTTNRLFVEADYVYTFAGLKHCLVSPSFLSSGVVVETLDIGITPAASRQTPFATYIPSPRVARDWLPTSSPDAHKFDKGHLLVLGGKSGETLGAPLLAGMGGFRTGVGLVTLYLPQNTSLQFSYPEVMIRNASGPEFTIADLEKVLAFITEKKVNALAIGMGIGRSEDTQKFLQALAKAVRDLNQTIPIVVDADGLALWHDFDSRENIFTPHPGEFDRYFKPTLAKPDTSSLRESIYSYLDSFSRSRAATLVHKSACKSIASNRLPFILQTGHPDPALATAGSGDIYAGCIGGLLAQNIPAELAASLASQMIEDAVDVLTRKMAPHAITASSLVEALGALAPKPLP